MHYINCSIIEWEKCRDEDQFCFGITHHTNFTSLDGDSGCLARYDCTVFVVGNKNPLDNRINITIGYNFMIIQKVQFQITIRPDNDNIQIISPVNTSSTVSTTTYTITPETTTMAVPTTTPEELSTLTWTTKDDGQLLLNVSQSRYVLDDEESISIKDVADNKTDYGVSFIASLDKEALINDKNHLLTIDHYNSEITVPPKIVTLNHRFMFFRYTTSEDKVGFNTSNTPVNIIASLNGSSSAGHVIETTIIERNMTLFGSTKKLDEENQLTEHKPMMPWVPPILLGIGVLIAVLLVMWFDRINKPTPKPKSPKNVEINSEESRTFSESNSTISPEGKVVVKSSGRMISRSNENANIPLKV